MQIDETMIGLFKTAKGPGNMELRESPTPGCQPNEVLIEIKAAGICGTDIHIKHDVYPYWPPVIMGHEFSGEIVQVGNKITYYKIGDRVVGEPHTLACGICELCRTGNRQICNQKRSPGWGINGAFAKYLAMPEELIHKIPDTLSFEDAALTEPAANVVQDVLERVHIIPNDTVVIIGPGAIGLMAVMCAKAAGAGRIILIGVEEDEELRLPVAREIGVDNIILADKQNASEKVMEITHGRGADVVIEASGARSAIQDSIHMVKRMGYISQIGLTGKETIPFPYDAAAWKVCTIVFNLSTAFTCWDRAIGMIASKQIDASKIITDVMPLHSWEKAFEKVEKKEAIKILLIP